MKHAEIISKMTLEDKIALCSGAGFWHTKAYEKYGIPAVMMCDGPHGLRKQEDASDMMGLNRSIPSTCFPTSASAGCSWDVDLACEVGRAIAEEARAEGVALVLGPGLNIERSPLCGRNFEYYSEDPLLSGKLAAAHVRGGQETGVGHCLKHFAANSQEYKRFSSDSVVDERTLREIYLSGFETAVKESAPVSVMSSYNKINGLHAGDDKWLLTDVLREEWGFNGFVVTDWGAMNDRIAAFRAGCDLNMPGGSAYQEKKVLKAVLSGELEEAYIDDCADRILEFVFNAQKIESIPCDMNAHHELARRAAENGAVLLKNNGALPLKGGAVLIGDMAQNLRYQGTGSSHIVPHRLVSPTDCMDYPFVKGCNADGSTTDAMIAEAVSAAKTAETALVFAGLPDSYESEGYDRANMEMPEGHLRLIIAVAEANPNTVVVLLCGSPVETPWIDKVNAVLYMALPGQAGGEAIKNLLTGAANPCGKLAQTWPLSYSDVVTKGFYGERDAQYREAVFVGYRYYESAGIPVRFPFGFGLSYTCFEYSDLSSDGGLVSVTVKNTGGLAGAEVVQLYVHPPKGGIFRPAKELKGFQKVFLQPGEAKTVTLPLDDRSFSLWSDGWKAPGGTYTVSVGSLEAKVEREGDSVPMLEWQEGSWYDTLSGAPTKSEWERLLGRKYEPLPLKKGKFTMDNSVLDMKQYSLVMKCLYWGVERMVAKRFGGRVDYSNPSFRMFMTSAADAALRALAITGGMSESIFEGFLDMANGRRLRGLMRIIRRN